LTDDCGRLINPRRALECGFVWVFFCDERIGNLYRKVSKVIEKAKKEGIGGESSWVFFLNLADSDKIALESEREG